VVFAIPLKPRSQSADWTTTELHLQRTIRSIRQAAEGVPALICIACHEAPRLTETRGQVAVLPVDFPQPTGVAEGNRDKIRKRRHIAAWVREHVRHDVRFAFVDADDLVHRGFLRAVLESRSESQLVTDGFIVDVAAGVVSRRAGTFHETCGSSFVCLFRRNELPTSWEDVEAPFSRFGGAPDERGHAFYGEIAAELGRASAPLGLPGVAYLVNHPDSLSGAKRGRRVLEGRVELVWPSRARRLLSMDFAARDLASELAGPRAAAAAYARAAIRGSRGSRGLGNLVRHAGLL
jgi:hypothetical protein